MNGKASIPYEINAGSCTMISADDLQGAIESAATTWERAAPAIDFTFAGFTDRAPVKFDGHNDIACTGTTSADTTVDHTGEIVEADMTFSPSGSWVWAPCEQRDGSCTPKCVPEPHGTPGACGIDIQSLATHEFGHWLWLGDIVDDTDVEMTMHPGSGVQMSRGYRFWSTLALGDVLGLRELYPCSCPLPPIYAP